MVQKKITIGLECHIIMKSARKLFCNCYPDKQVCEICRGVPGSLPLDPDITAVSKALKLAKVLNSKINPLIFYRKHYRYYDLPCGYQRTQSPKHPFFIDSSLYLIKAKKNVKCKGYLEEDPASIKKNVVNFKRCGSPLIQVVTQKISSYDLIELIKIIKEFLYTLKRLAIDLKISNSSKVLKTDLNVSIEGSPRYEIKNITSFKDIISALKLSVGLLKTDTSEVKKTYSFTNGKIWFSRIKEEYLFLRDWNVRPLKVVLKSSLEPSMYLLLNTNLPYSSLKYQYYKKLLSAFKEGHLDESLWDLAKKDPKVGQRELEIILKESRELKTEVEKFSTQFTSKDFLEKSSFFLKLLKEFKKDLTSKGIKYTSYVINHLLTKKFNLRIK